MFNIAMDESGNTCNSHELVKNKSASEVGNAKKRKYFCVTCQDAKHPVSLNIRHKVQNVNKKARNYTSIAWFSHHCSGGAHKGSACGGNGGHSKRDNPSPETAMHWQAKHILCKDVGRYSYVTSRCSGCERHTQVEDGTGARGRVEHREKKADGKHYRFDAVLMRGDTVSSVMEVWATHETCESKREYCLEMGFTFSEFNAQHVLDAHDTALEGECYGLENLKVRLFECQDCRNNNEFYHKTCTGAETRIIQLQESLYANYLDELWRGRKWVVVKQQGIESALARADKIRSGVIKHNWTQYKAGVSFKCFCGKWVREDTSKPVCSRMYRCERNDEFFVDLQNKTSARIYKSDFPNDIHMKMCGLCSISCVICNEPFLLRTAVTTGCCEACSSALVRGDDDISRSLKADIAHIQAGDEFRGFFDFAIEYRPIFLAQRAARQLEDTNRRLQALSDEKNARLQAACDEKNARQQAFYNTVMNLPKLAYHKEKTRLQAWRENLQTAKNEMREKMLCGADPEELRFTEFLMERRKQMEQLDKATQLWKTKNFAAWSKKESWQQERDRELSFAVYRQGCPNPHSEFH